MGQGVCRRGALRHRAGELSSYLRSRRVIISRCRACALSTRHRIRHFLPPSRSPVSLSPPIAGRFPVASRLENSRAVYRDDGRSEPWKSGRNAIVLPPRSEKFRRSETPCRGKHSRGLAEPTAKPTIAKYRRRPLSRYRLESPRERLVALLRAGRIVNGRRASLRSRVGYYRENYRAVRSE